MFRSILKWTFFTSAILLLGQVSVGGDTIAKRFKDSVSGAVAWCGDKARHSEAYAKVSHSSYLPRWVRRRMQTGTTQRHASRPAPKNDYAPETASSGDEEISSSDRESLLRLLQ